MRKKRKQYGAEEKIRIGLDELRGEDSIAELRRPEGISQSLYYKWPNEFIEAGKKRLAGDIVRQANTSEVTDLRREARDLQEVVAEQTPELRLLKKACSVLLVPSSIAVTSTIALAEKRRCRTKRHRQHV